MTGDLIPKQKSSRRNLSNYKERRFYGKDTIISKLEDAVIQDSEEV